MTRNREACASGKVEAELARLATLRKTKGRKAIPRFLAALRHPDLAVAKMAAMGLCDRKAVLSPLRELLADPDLAMRWRACTLAWWFTVPRFVPDLIQALRDSEPMVRAEAAWALRCADSNAAARALLRAAKDPDRMVAHYAAWTLRHYVRPRHADLPALKAARIPQLPLLPERPRRRAAAPPAVKGDAHAFEQFACSARLPAYRAPLAAPAEVDGKRDSRYGQAASASLGHLDGYPQPPARSTDFRVVCSSDALHFHVRCEYHGRKELAARHTTYGSPVFTDNSIDIFLDPTGTGSKRYFQISLNTRNARCDVLARSPARHVWQPDGHEPDPRTWRPKRIRTAVRVEKGYWNAELAVPFADLGLRPGKVNKLWRMNIARNAHLSGFYENTSWCDLGDSDAHRPERFGYLWVDAGNVVNADAKIFQSVPLPLKRGLKGWTVLRGRFRVGAGEIAVVPGSAALRWDKPLPFEQFEVTAQIQMRHQIRFMFSPDPDNSVLSFDAAYLNLINEVHFAHVKHWRDWAPAYPGVLTIYKEVYPRLTHSRWYEAAIRVGRDRCQLLLDGAVHIEMPNPGLDVRYFGLAFVAGGRLRKLRFRPLE